MFAGSRPLVRTFVIISLVATLVISFVYSDSVRFGHADVPLAATAADIQPLVAGDTAPHFTVETVAGERFEFEPRKLERPVMLVSFRGGWCPYCNLHLSELRHVLPEIQGMGIDVLFLSGDRSDILVKSLRSETREAIDGLGYTILSDANARAALALGIAFRASDRTIERRRQNGDDIESSSMARHGVLPVPAVFAINQDGIITFMHANPDYKVRLSADELLDAANGLARGK